MAPTGRKNLIDGAKDRSPTVRTKKNIRVRFLRFMLLLSPLLKIMLATTRTAPLFGQTANHPLLECRASVGNGQVPRV